MKARRSTLVLAVAAGLSLASSGYAAPQTSGSVRANAATRLSEAQLAEVQARTELAGEIVRNVSADAQAKGLGDSWRVGLLGALYSTPSYALRNIRGTVKTLDEAHARVVEAQVDAVEFPAKRASTGNAVAAGIGSPIDSLVFTPMTPCRFIDTRIVGGSIGTVQRSFDTAFSGASYGGSANCALPFPATHRAIAANVTIVNPSVAAGYLSIRSFASSNVTSWLNWYQVATVTANAGTITTDLNGAFHDAFEILTGGGTTDVVVDFFGYFEKAVLPKSTCTSSETDELVTLPVGFNGIRTTTLACPAGTTAVSPMCSSSSAIRLTAAGIDGGNAYCGWNNTFNKPIDAFQNVICCQVP